MWQFAFRDVESSETNRRCELIDCLAIQASQAPWARLPASGSASRPDKAGAGEIWSEVGPQVT